MQQQVQQLQQQFLNRTFQNGPSQELTLQFPNYAGTPRRGDSGTLNLPPEPARTQEAARQSLPPTSLPALPHPALPPTTLPPTSLPPPPATISSASAVKERGDEAGGTSEKLTVPPPLGGPAAEPANPKKRMSVAETTAALLAKISAPKGTAESAKPKKEKSEKKMKKKNKKKKKKEKKLASDSSESDSSSGDSATTAPAPKPRPRPLPDIRYKDCKDHFETFFDKLLCQSFPYKGKEPKASAQKLAED